MNQVAVTGIGIVTSIGSDVETFWLNLLKGQSGFSDVASFDTRQYRVHRGAEIKDDKWTRGVLHQEDYVLGRATQLALAASRMALLDAGLDEERLDPGRTGIIMGTTSGEPQEIERFNDLYLAQGLDRLGSRFTNSYPCNHIPGFVATRLGLYGGGGPLMLPVACAAGNYAISHAFDSLRAQEADVMLAGGVDAFSRIPYTGFAGLLAIAPDRCQPFDRNRKGMIPGEGAAMLVLERFECAQKRGARIYAEIGGYGLACDAFHMTGSDPTGAGAARAMERALEQSGCTPEDVDYISAHGTGTKSNDLHETIAIKRVFAEQAYYTPVSSVKSMLGHTMGAASAIEAAVCCLAITHGAIPPTMNLEEADPECDLDYVPNEAREHSIQVAMNNAYAFGGTNASLILKRSSL